MNISFPPSICIHRSFILIFIEKKNLVNFFPWKIFCSAIFDFSARILVSATNSRLCIWLSPDGPVFHCQQLTLLFPTYFTVSSEFCAPSLLLSVVPAISLSAVNPSVPHYFTVSSEFRAPSLLPSVVPAISLSAVNPSVPHYFTVSSEFRAPSLLLSVVPAISLSAVNPSVPHYFTVSSEFRAPSLLLSVVPAISLSAVNPSVPHLFHRQ